MQVRKQQLELDMEQQTGFKEGKEYVKAVYCHPAYLTYMQCTSWETLDWKKHKLESRLPAGEDSYDSLLSIGQQERRSNQLILKEINSEDSLEGWMLKLKLQHFGHLMPRANSLVKTLMLGKTEGRRRREQHRMRRLDGLTDAMDVVGANSRK